MLVSFAEADFSFGQVAASVGVLLESFFQRQQLAAFELRVNSPSAASCLMPVPKDWRG